MRLVLLGPPGAGKTAQAELLSERRGFTRISTGDIIRSAAKCRGRAGRKISSLVDKGKLAPDHLARKAAEQAIAACGYDRFVLDGYPRTLQQARWLTELLEKRGEPLSAALYLRVPGMTAMGRLSGRRVHAETGATYHLQADPPPAKVSPDAVTRRSDDSGETARTRLDTYYDRTAPLRTYYRNQGRCASVDGVGTIEEVHDRVSRTLSEVQTGSFG